MRPQSEGKKPVLRTTQKHTGLGFRLGQVASHCPPGTSQPFWLTLLLSVLRARTPCRTDRSYGPAPWKNTCMIKLYVSLPGICCLHHPTHEHLSRGGEHQAEGESAERRPVLAGGRSLRPLTPD